MSAQYTRGPWLYVDAEKRADMQFSKMCVIRGGGKQIAAFSWQDPSIVFPSKKESQANARLIAAAPEMVEVLRAVTDLLVSELGELANEDEISDDTLGPWLGHEYAKQVISARVRIKQARAILAKIDGEG